MCVAVAMRVGVTWLCLAGDQAKLVLLRRVKTHDLAALRGKRGNKAWIVA